MRRDRRGGVGVRAPARCFPRAMPVPSRPVVHGSAPSPDIFAFLRKDALRRWGQATAVRVDERSRLGEPSPVAAIPLAERSLAVRFCSGAWR